MCGIVGYIGKNGNAINLAVKGLKLLEYRGYDSAGVAACVGNSSVFFRRTVGRVKNLIQQIGTQNRVSNCAIAHTRWATHGKPSVRNAHPHYDCKKTIYLVHNGIIENYACLKEVLIREGHIFSSDTDTEVLAHLIERGLGKYTSLEDAVIEALPYIRGTFALAVISRREPEKIVAARRSSPLIVGLGSTGSEYFLASDASAVVEYTKHVIYLDDDEVAVLTTGGCQFLNLNKKIRKKPVSTIDWDVSQSQKGGFPHFMLKEIHGQPESITDSLRGRLVEKEGRAKLGGLDVLKDRVRGIKRFVITACGTSYYAGLVGQRLFEHLARIPAEVVLASEFRYGRPVLSPDTAMLIISQSGETADGLAALRLAKKLPIGDPKLLLLFPTTYATC